MDWTRSAPGDDAKWIIATVTTPSDVRAAVMLINGKRTGDWPAITEWVRGQVGSRVRLVPVTAIVWCIDREAAAERPDGREARHRLAASL